MAQRPTPFNIVIECRTTVHTLGLASGMSPKRSAFLLVSLMVLLPWTSFSDYELLDEDKANTASARVWGSSGYNDTGWIDLEATGADPSSQTYAYSDLFLEFAPGAEISNLTFEIAVDGSDGFCIDEPQLTLMNSQTPILDWRGNDWLGCQYEFNDKPPELVDGELSTSLQPNSVSDASWILPAGISISDLVIEALTPSDPRISFAPLEIAVHGTAVNPYDGRMYVLLGDDLIHLDSKASEACEWRCPGIVHIDELVYGRSIDIDQSRGMLVVGTSNGTIFTQSLNDSGTGPSVPIAQESITAIASDSDGSMWAIDGCNVRFISPNSEDLSISSQWDEYQYCSTPSGVEQY